MMPVVDEHGKVVQLDAVRAQRFLHSLRDKPFIALIQEDDHVRLYAKGLDNAEALRMMQGVIAELNEGTSSADEGS